MAMEMLYEVRCGVTEGMDEFAHHTVTTAVASVDVAATPYSLVAACASQFISDVT